MAEKGAQRLRRQKGYIRISEDDVFLKLNGRARCVCGQRNNLQQTATDTLQDD